jgi:hypothetical protein
LRVAVGADGAGAGFEERFSEKENPEILFRYEGYVSFVSHVNEILLSSY